MELRNKRMLVVGLGKSGRAAAMFLAKRGARVVANDVRPEVEDADAMLAAGVELALGGHDVELFRSVDHIIVSPGVPPLPALDAAEQAGVPIASEIELASWFIDSWVVAITGTNGKSTVTSLIGEMLTQTGRPTFVGGNLGTPLVDVVGTDAAKPGGFVVVELSSFQLERVDRFRANVAVLLNITDDHLDRYDSFAGYAAAKGRVFAGQNKADHAVVPQGDELCTSMARAGAAGISTFGPGGDVTVDAGGEVVFPNGQYGHLKTPHLNDRKSGAVVAIEDMKLRGAHNALNACAAALAARLSGVEHTIVESVLKEFPGLPHRMQYVRELDGVRYYDDSKATNVGAAVAAMRGFDGRVVLIAGGKDKGGSYQPLVDALAQQGRALVTLGEAASLIEDAVGDTLPWERAETMADAVTRARRLAQPGDAVLLAPACSSFDMYRSYAQRGDDFHSAVQALGGAS